MPVTLPEGHLQPSASKCQEWLCGSPILPGTAPGGKASFRSPLCSNTFKRVHEGCDKSPHSPWLWLWSHQLQRVILQYVPMDKLHRKPVVDSTGRGGRQKAQQVAGTPLLPAPPWEPWG